MSGKTTLPAFILVTPQLGENIGAAARAMANFGLSEMRLVAPRDGWPNEKARQAASGADHILKNAQLYEDVGAAVADLNWLAATTARPRDMAKHVMTPSQAAREMVARSGRGERCGVLFGPERSGLNNDDVAIADVIVMAPVAPDFASLNLAQAVLLVAYEWLKHAGTPTLGRATAHDGPTQPGQHYRHSRPATKAELLGLFEHLERELDKSGFLHPPEKRPVMVRNIRNMLGRMGASEQEVRTLRGIVAALAHAHKRENEAP